MEIKTDDGFWFGLGAFETIALYKEQPVFLEEHLQRLFKTAEYFGWGDSAKERVTKESLRQWLSGQKTACFTDDRKSGQGSERKHLLAHGALKIMLSEKNLQLSLRSNPYQEEQYAKGFTMDFSSVRRNETSPLTAHKTLNYGDCILEKRAATKTGMNERIFLNTKGQIAEGCVSNIFVVRKGEILTPDSSCGLLPGIMRAYVMHTVPVTETILYPEDLADCEECFVTNSLMGIMPVRQLGKYTFSSGKTAEQLIEQYRKAVKTL